ncbi:hypothetical protein [Halobacterium jilantaiense]|uniref:Uncharacterized protein n=1 Tax=Halobacterium jilantaiense TaxID=355548 RepID=A0A1I0QEF5_9EURY|nr:hypothetical protein [Halobacterium jilantaiense]SEW25271.1 hypothetical protein SAMN04487945_2519 [Halobacterium jilantaiense]
MASLGAFGVLEVVGLIVAVLGLLPVLSQYKDETKWFTAGYLLLVVGMIATNLEAVVLPVVLNVTEHVVGIGLAGITFLFAAYQRRQDIVERQTSEVTDG